jgi:hypothetical protein
MKLKDLIQNLFGKPASQPDMTDEVVLKVINILERARAEEITCDDMFAQLDQFVEHKFHGRDVEKIAPLLREHLDICSECHEEYAALLHVLESTHKN